MMDGNSNSIPFAGEGFSAVDYSRAGSAAKVFIECTLIHVLKSSQAN